MAETILEPRSKSGMRRRGPSCAPASSDVTSESLCWSCAISFCFCEIASAISCTFFCRSSISRAEMVARMFWMRTERGRPALGPPTRLTQRHKREAKGKSPEQAPISAPRWENSCPGCGKAIQDRSTTCVQCGIDASTERLVNAAKLGRVAARSPEARAKHVASRQRHAQACSEWDASTLPAWLTSEVFSQQIQPLLANIPTSAIRSRIGVSRWYAGRIRQGYRPHPRHWQALAETVGWVSNDS